ncbi:MAG TPA: hypothetical protein DD490_01115, partial [Acidobacteria bacterium]|nr:hypothetical protein [Acidobacteriota bacterium]
MSRPHPPTPSPISLPAPAGRGGALWALLALLALPAAAQPAPELHVALRPPGTLTVGDRVEATLTLRIDPQGQR